jgi:hypothetical protein
VTPIITEEFIGRDWPRRELNAAFVKEVATRRVVVLPILAADQELFFTRYLLLSVLHQPANASAQHRLTLRWGAYIRHVEWTPGGVAPISFIHHKTNPDLVTLHASVEPLLS